MEETNIPNNTNQASKTLPVNSINPKPDNLYKYLFFVSLIILFGVIGYFIYTNNNNSQLLINNTNNDDETNSTEIVKKEDMVEKDQTDVLISTTNQTLPEEKWLIPFIPGTVDQVLVKDPKIISYKESPDISVSVIKFDVLSYIEKASVLAEYSHECSGAFIERDEDYYTKILSKFNTKNKGYFYEFKYTGKSQVESRKSWLITVIPNNINYTNIENFKNDFMQCAAGGDRYPRSISKNYLFFDSACGTGFSDDSGLPIGCNIAKEVIEPTLKLN